MEVIDLNLPSGTLWGATNIGAQSQADNGSYFAWGDTFPKSNYIGRTCQTYDLDIASLKFQDFVDSWNVLTPDYDAATQILGKEWSMPSGEQAQELVDNCTWQWTDDYQGTGKSGMLGKSKHNNAEIFLPAAGYRNNEQLLMDGKCGGYWTGAPNFVAANRAWSIAFEGNLINVFNHGLRYNGYSIRPVTRKR